MEGYCQKGQESLEDHGRRRNEPHAGEMERSLQALHRETAEKERVISLIGTIINEFRKCFLFSEFVYLMRVQYKRINQ